MAVRLNVMIIRPLGHGGPADEQCDHAVGTLLGRPGIDVTLIDSIPHPDDDVTELMAIESIAGPIAVLSWQPVDEVMRGFQRLGRTWVRTPHRRDPEVPADSAAVPGAAKLFFFDMNRKGASESILADVQRLLSVQSQPTFTIGLPNASPNITRSPRPSTGSLDDLVDELDRLDP